LYHLAAASPAHQPAALQLNEFGVPLFHSESELQRRLYARFRLPGQDVLDIHNLPAGTAARYGHRQQQKEAGRYTEGAGAMGAAAGSRNVMCR